MRTVKHLLTASLIAFSLNLSAQDIELVLYASGFEVPVDISNADDGRLFITEKNGTIKIIDSDGTVLFTPFLDIDDRVNSGATERGLLGLVFHPNYQNNGYFYVNYTTLNGATRISRFSVTEDNSNIADPDSELIIYTIGQPYNNHNGGDLSFGPDGYLYIGLGDGGSGGDPDNYAQNPQSGLGKMLRIDVDNTMPNLNYSIPPDNPFANTSAALSEIWALGLRNPWRFSFDRETGDMWVSDVGQDDWEEINFQPAASVGGENYGWRCYEGNAPFDLSWNCPSVSELTPPVHTYANGFATGCSVTGGFVYRGTTYPELYGKYLYADYCSGRFWTLSPDGSGGWDNTLVGNFGDEEYATFGEDKNGELYVASTPEGEIYRIISCGEPFLPTLTPSGTINVCQGDTVTLTASEAPEGYSYQWFTGLSEYPIPGETEQTLSLTSDKNSYYVEYVGECPSYPSNSVDVYFQEVPTPVILGTPDGNLEVEGGTAYGSYNTYTWYLNGEIINAPSCDGTGYDQWCIQPDEAGIYTVCVYYGDIYCTNCSESFLYTSTENIAAIDDIQISPIPTNDILYINLNTNKKINLQIKLQNIHGQTLIEKEQSINGTWNTSLNINHLSSGTYFLTLQSGNEIMTKKVLIY